MAETALPSPLPARMAVFRRAALWLAFLAPFFYLSYGTANWLASQRSDVPNLAFGWEGAIPFLAWTIVPYWSINLFYALCLFINDRQAEVDTLGRRYLAIQLVAVSCFVAFPLQAIFVRPETHGLPGFMFTVLGGFDKPFNQAPSLHIALLVVIWDHLRGKIPHAARLVWHGWCFLIGISVLTTWQHHSIDIPTGLLLGFFAAWLFPRGAAPPLAGFRPTADAKARRLGCYYLGAALGFLALAVFGTLHSGAALFLTWPALAMAIVAAGYVGAGPKIFQKRADGRASLASRWLLAPYRLGVIANIGWWTRGAPAAVEITDGVYLGRFPTRREADAFATVVDMTGELCAPRRTRACWHAFPSLDLVRPPPGSVSDAARLVETLRPEGPMLVCCALGFQRSAAVVGTWLVATGRAGDASAAVARITQAGRRIHLQPDMIAT